MSKEIFEKMEERFKQNKASGFSQALGCEVKKVYTHEDIGSSPDTRDNSDPDEYPFTRGIHKLGYRGRLWTMRELVGFTSAEDTRQRFTKLAEMGTSALTLVPDLVTCGGFDPDDPICRNDIGVDGVPLTTLKDFETLFEGIPLDKISANVLMGTCVAPIGIALFIALAKKQGVEPSKLKGSVVNCPIKDYFVSHKAGAPSLELCLKTVGDVIEYCAKYMPSFNPFVSNVVSFRNFGISAAMEVAIGFAIVIAHLDEALGRGLNIDAIAPRVSFVFCNEVQFFEEIAKYRAARRMWARLLRDKYGAKNPRSWQLRIGSVAGGHVLTPQEPLNNIARLTLEVLSAVLGGAQSIQVAGYDEAICLPTEESHRLSLRIQQIIAFETGVANVVDPLGGSYYMEYLTNKIEEKANEILDKMEKMGGIASTEGSKWVASQLEEALQEYYGGLDEGVLPRVGMNIFALPGEMEQEVEIHRIPDDAGVRHIARVKEIKQRRDNIKVAEALKELSEVAIKRKGENLIPYIIEAVEQYATVGEIFKTIKRAYGISWI